MGYPSMTDNKYNHKHTKSKLTMHLFQPSFQNNSEAVCSSFKQLVCYLDIVVDYCLLNMFIYRCSLLSCC